MLVLKPQGTPDMIIRGYRWVVQYICIQADVVDHKPEIIFSRNGVTQEVEDALPVQLLC
jgi:hypothetical protein